MLQCLACKDDFEDVIWTDETQFSWSAIGGIVFARKMRFKPRPIFNGIMDAEFYVRILHHF